MRFLALALLFWLRITPSEAQIDEAAERARARTALLRQGAASYAVGDLTEARRAYQAALLLEDGAEAHLGLAQVACAEHNYGSCEQHAHAALRSAHPLDKAGRSRAEWLLAEVFRVSSLEPEPSLVNEAGTGTLMDVRDACAEERRAALVRLAWAGAALVLVAGFAAGLLISADHAAGL